MKGAVGQHFPTNSGGAVQKGGLVPRHSPPWDRISEKPIANQRDEFGHIDTGKQNVNNIGIAPSRFGESVGHNRNGLMGRAKHPAQLRWRVLPCAFPCPVLGVKSWRCTREPRATTSITARRATIRFT